MDSNKKEKLQNTTLDRINFWIGNGDAKVSFVVSFTGIFLGFIFASDSISTSVKNYIKSLGAMKLQDVKILLSALSLILFVVSIFFIMRAIYYFLMALQAQIKPSEYQQSNLETKSLLFWQTISQLDYATYKQKLNTVQDQALENDLDSQVYINSIITTRKFDMYNKGLKQLRNGIIVFVIFKFLTYFPF
ncbi:MULTISPECIES: Pycsar system effector family protein [Bacillus cereus group]|uniref:Pycsar system effector family protein n=1 Tax=Bacillus cereus group TaxID=86661 RepID=UPI001E2909E6|nr:MULTISPECIES: Pycsar system effector family protein [Bacillus cereus group]MCC2414303.1 DUF5706 domain-containing protein [Bacillus paranthracis]MDX5923203.1 DUF5706 domain-containing protein [Bacillus cereus group sp. BfR-BA-01033]MDX5975779.1 DUF5706 domain-containing protein [Bacillus cereus group sp. BfR-BA-00287]